MPIFLIPILILFGVFVLTAGDNLIKSIDLPLPDFRLFPEKQEAPAATPTPSTPRASQIRQAAPGPSPPSPTPAKEPQAAEPATSPFFGKVEIASARASTKAAPSLITLRPRIGPEESVNLTGWKITGRNGSFTIPLGIQQIEPGIHDTPVDPIAATRSDTIQLSSAKSPFGLGRNFRPNICMGYLKNSYAFPISISTSCSFQKPRERDLLSLSQQCQDFILKKINFSSCVVPQYPENPNILQEGTSECASYLQENFTYHACFNRYQDTSNFTKNEWHVYMNTDFINPNYDFLQLFDAQGLLVATRELQ